MKDTLQQDAERFAQFIVANYPDSRQWADPTGYCAWYIGHGFVAVVIDEDGKIVALGSARPVERPGMGVLPFYYNEEGTCLHIDLLIDVNKDSKSIIALREICRRRFPQCNTVTMFRHFEESIHVYPINKFWRSLEKIKRTKKEKQTHAIKDT
jgi:hypothetical protein